MAIIINSNHNRVSVFPIKCLVLACSILSLITSISHAQIDSIRKRSFDYYNAHDKHSLFLENESRSLPGEKDSTYSITIIVKNIRNKEGVIRFKFYDDSTSFPHDKGFLRIVVQKADIKCNTFIVTFHGFISRHMGIALHDDENGNKKLDFHWLSPAEGYAFSDYYHTSFRRPDYSDFRFHLKGDRNVIMKMRYH